MVINVKDFDKLVQNEVNKALNGDDSPFAKAALAERDSTIKELTSQEEVRRNNPKYTPKTAAQIQNEANEKAAARAGENIKKGLNTAKVAGDDSNSMTELMLGLAFGGGGSMISMIGNIIKGESPFWKTVKESFSGGKIELGNFKERWQANIEDKSLTDYAEKNGISKNELVAALSRTDGAEVKLAKVPEADPAQTKDQKQAILDSAIEETREKARLQARLEFERDQAALQEKERLKSQNKSGKQNSDAKKNDSASAKKPVSFEQIDGAQDALKGVASKVSQADSGHKNAPFQNTKGGISGSVEL